MATLTPAGLHPHKILELLFHLPTLRTSFDDTVAVTHKQYPDAKPDNIQQQRMFRTERGFEAGYGNEGGKQEKYRRFHTMNILKLLVIRAK